MEIISKKTRSEFQEFLVSKTLREISLYFDNNDVQFTPLPEGQAVGGQRRTLLENYYTAIDWTNQRQVKKILAVYADIPRS